MRTLYIVCLILVVIGGLNWALIGLFNWNLVSTIFGVKSFLTNLIYILVGASAIVSLGFFRYLDQDKA